MAIHAHIQVRSPAPAIEGTQTTRLRKGPRNWTDRILTGLEQAVVWDYLERYFAATAHDPYLCRARYPSDGD